MRKTMSEQKPLPKYRCHKEVWALKIKSIAFDSDRAKLGSFAESDGSAMITPEDASYAPFKVDREFCQRHDPQPGDYYVVYSDGYKSISPAKAFEDGYTLITE